MCNRALEICIIDSGVNEGALQTGRVGTNVEITGKLQVRRRPRYNGRIINHATVCAAIIRKYAPDAVLHSVKILNSREKSTMEQLRAAVLWCLENNIGIIHMSIGSIIHSDFAEIRRLANMAWRQGTVIVAACNNNGRVTYPAALDSAIGVKCDRSGRLREGEYIYNGVSPDGVEITACGRHSLTMPSGRSFDTACANSYAAPLVTALVYNIMRSNSDIGPAGIKAALREGAGEKHSGLYKDAFSRYIDWVENAMVIDFGDNRQFLNDIELPFKMVGLMRPGLPCGRDILEAIRKASAQADSIILLPPDSRNNPDTADITSLLEEIGGLNKNVVYCGEGAADTMACSMSDKQGSRLWHPGIYQGFDYKCHLKKEIGVPAIMLYAGSPQLLVGLLQKLAGAFVRDGYHAIGLSDSALGILAGLEYLCPGAAAQVYGDSLQAFYNLYGPDVMLIGFSEENSFAAAANELKPDIKLVFPDDSRADGLVYIVPEEDEPVRQHGGNTIALEYTKEGGIDRIYECILSVLGAESEPVEELR